MRSILSDHATRTREDLLPHGERGRQAAAFDARALFIERWTIIKRSLDVYRKPGVLILAFDSRKPAFAQTWLPSTLDRTRAALIGRHSMCDIRVDSEDVSLRHLAVLVRAASLTESRIRLIDLHTPSAFSDEEGRVLQAVTTEGSLFVRIGDVFLMLLVTEEGDMPAEHAESAYECIPARVFLDESLGIQTEPRPRRAVAAPPADRSSTRVRSRLGPLAAQGTLCDDGDVEAGTLVIRSVGGSALAPVGVQALERGFLVGRYARCDVGARDEGSSRLSRVHLLVVRDSGSAVALDTASVNGTHLDEKPIKLHALSDGDVLDLGGELELEWREGSTGNGSISRHETRGAPTYGAGGKMSCVY